MEPATSTQIKAQANDLANSKDIGKQVEGKTANALLEAKVDVKAVGTDVYNKEGRPVGEIDISTSNHIVEVKKSAAAVEQSQIERMIDPSHPDYINLHGKKPILYIEEPLNQVPLEKMKILNYAETNGILIITDINELIEVLR